MTVRPARDLEEARRAGELVKAMFEQRDIGGPAYREHLRDVDPRIVLAEILVAVDEQDTVIGSVTYVRAGTTYALASRPGEAELRMLGVAPRRERAEALLVDACIERAERDGCSALVMCALRKQQNDPGRVYRRRGFKLVPGRGLSPIPGVRLVVFSRPLGPAAVAARRPLRFGRPRGSG